MKERREILRMCVACRSMKDKSQLLRIVKNKDGAVCVDEGTKLQGRGASVCKSVACIEKAKKQKAFSRAFKCAIDDAVYEELYQALSRIDTKGSV